MKVDKTGLFWICFFLLLSLIGSCVRISVSATSEQEIRNRFYGNLVNSTAPETGDGTIAKMFDRLIQKEFSENDQPEG